jgi:hypothetical protein
MLVPAEGKEKQSLPAIFMKQFYELQGTTMVMSRIFQTN